MILYLGMIFNNEYLARSCFVNSKSYLQCTKAVYNFFIARHIKGIHVNTIV